MAQQNNNYNKIISNNHEIVIMFGDNGYSKLILVIKNVKVHTVFFKDNRQSKSKMYELIKTARRFTHLGNALEELAEVSDKYMAKALENGEYPNSAKVVNE
jgi:hypothetical protein